MLRVNVGQGQGFMTLPWLFNLFMDGIMREVSARVFGRGVEFQHNGHEWEINDLLHEDDTVLVAALPKSLQRLDNVFGKV